jgi:NDP-sugar pyrophosphorylase family protein
MAGGRGTRLGPVTENIPKPMVRVAGRPILERLILHLVGFGIRRIFLSVNYLADVISGHFGDGAKFGCRIEYLRESEPLGTGGALSLLKEKPASPLIVLNGDLVTQVNLADMLDFHGRGRYAATMGVRQYTHQVPFGCVELQGDRVVGLEEKPILDRCVNAGVYVLEPSLLARVPKSAYPITALFEDCLAKKEPVGAFEIREDWIDVGHRDQLKQAQQGQS